MVMPLNILCFKNLSDIQKENLPHGLSWMYSRIVIEEPSRSWKHFLCIFSSARAVLLQGAYVDERFMFTNCTCIPQHAAIAFKSGIVFFRYGPTNEKFRDFFKRRTGRTLLRKWDRDDFNMYAYVQKLVNRQIEFQMEHMDIDESLIAISNHYSLEGRQKIYHEHIRPIMLGEHSKGRICNLIVNIMQMELKSNEIACITHPFQWCRNRKWCTWCSEYFKILYKPGANL